MGAGYVRAQERAAIEAVARRFSATWEKGSNPPDAYIMVAGKQVAVDITTLKRRGTGQGNAAKPRLRFDKVATRLIERLQATPGKTVPDGTDSVADHHRSHPFAIENHCLAGRQNTNSSRAGIAGSR